MNSKDTSFTIHFAPQQVLAEAETQLQRAMRQTTNAQIEAFFGETRHYVGNELKRTPGAGLLLIRDFLEKKFDDPETQARMEAYFEANFERIMGECMEKALQHKANAFVFGKAKEK